MRRGKIGRLAKEIREELNRRMECGESAKSLAKWLNALPEVQGVLAADFNRVPISEQNLSDWRWSGYRDWARQEEARAWVRVVTAQDGKAVAGESVMSRHLGTMMSVEAARVVQEWLSAEDDDKTPDVKERWRRLKESLAAVGTLREEERKLGWMGLERKRLEAEWAEARTEDCKAAARLLEAVFKAKGER